MDHGVGFPVLGDPFRIQLVGASINPFPIEIGEGDQQHVESYQRIERHVGHDDVLHPQGGIRKDQEHFLRRHHDAHEEVVGEEDEGGEREEAHRRKADERRQFLPDVHTGNHIHDEEDQKLDGHGREEIGREMIEGRIGDAIHCVGEHVGENQNPCEEGDVADAPEGMEEALPGEELGEEEKEPALHEASKAAIPSGEARDAQEEIVAIHYREENQGTQKVQADLLRRDARPPKRKFFALLCPEISHDSFFTPLAIVVSYSIDGIGHFGNSRRGGLTLLV